VEQLADRADKIARGIARHRDEPVMHRLGHKMNSLHNIGVAVRDFHTTITNAFATLPKSIKDSIA